MKYYAEVRANRNTDTTDKHTVMSESQKKKRLYSTEPFMKINHTYLQTPLTSLLGLPHIQKHISGTLESVLGWWRGAGRDNGKEKRKWGLNIEELTWVKWQTQLSISEDQKHHCHPPPKPNSPKERQNWDQVKGGKKTKKRGFAIRKQGLHVWLPNLRGTWPKTSSFTFLCLSSPCIKKGGYKDFLKWLWGLNDEIFYECQVVLSPETAKQSKCKVAPIWHQKHSTQCVGFSTVTVPETQSLMGWHTCWPLGNSEITFLIHCCKHFLSFLLVPHLRRLLQPKISFLTLHRKEITMSPFIKAENQVTSQKEADYLPCPTSLSAVWARPQHTVLKGRILPPKKASSPVP